MKKNELYLKIVNMQCVARQNIQTWIVHKDLHVSPESSLGKVKHTLYLILDIHAQLDNF